MTDTIMPAATFESSLVEDPGNAVEPYAQVSVQCGDCFGTGFDQVKAPNGFVVGHAGSPGELMCRACEGKRRVTRWISVYALQQFVLESVVSGMSNLLSMMKEQAVKDVMES